MAGCASGLRLPRVADILCGASERANSGRHPTRRCYSGVGLPRSFAPKRIADQSATERVVGGGSYPGHWERLVSAAVGGVRDRLQRLSRRMAVTARLEATPPIRSPRRTTRSSRSRTGVNGRRARRRRTWADAGREWSRAPAQMSSMVYRLLAHIQDALGHPS